MALFNDHKSSNCFCPSTSLNSYLGSILACYTEISLSSVYTGVPLSGQLSSHFLLNQALQPSQNLEKKRANWVIFLKQLFCHDTAFILKQNAIIFKIYLYFVKFCQGGTLNMHNFSLKMQTLFFVTWRYAL